jgi:protein MAK16
MQHDDVIWSSVHQGFCSFKVKTVKQNFCRNKYNITGLCSRASCPLANSRYATIVESEDSLYLCIKTVERAHSPRNLWQKIKLSRNYRAALAQIDKHLEHWPEFYIHKAKQRLTKMVQYHIRKQRIALRTKTRLVGIKKKVERRERTREAKAVAAAKLDKAIEKELLERLRSGAYGDIYNFPQAQYEKVLEDEVELEDDSEEEFEDESVDDERDEYEAEYEYEDESEVEDIEDAVASADGRPQYDFDDSGSDDEDERASGPVQDPMARARERARNRATGLLEKPRGRRGRSLRNSEGMNPAQVELEYEHEKESGRVREGRS